MLSCSHLPLDILITLHAFCALLFWPCGLPQGLIWAEQYRKHTEDRHRGPTCSLKKAGMQPGTRHVQVCNLFGMPAPRPPHHSLGCKPSIHTCAACAAHKAQSCSGDLPEPQIATQLCCKISVEVVAAPAQLLARAIIQPVPCQEASSFAWTTWDASVLTSVLEGSKRPQTAG